MEDVAGGDPQPGTAWEPLCASETLWVAVDDSDQPVGFLAAGEQDDLLFIYELSVSSPWQRQGIGRALLAEADAFARDRGLAGVALTTFHDVPWNRPFYERLGYRVTADTALPPLLSQVMASEHARWPAPDRRRCAMIKPAGAPGSAES